MAATVGIVGMGYVGKAYARLFSRKFNVVGYDPNHHGDQWVEGWPNSQGLVNAADLVLVCVPTPMGRNGQCDTTILEEVFHWCQPAMGLVVIKSTVSPGTTWKLADRYPGLSFCFSPEYIGSEPTWPSQLNPSDPLSHGFVIIGGANEDRARDALEFFKPVLGAETRYITTTAETAELVKYMENSFLATKVAFCNEWADIAHAFGVSYDELRELWLADRRIGPSHTQVFRNDRGFGGRCLPKDLSAIIVAAKTKGYRAEILKAVLEANMKWRGDD